jgi:hypothetical protein
MSPDEVMKNFVEQQEIATDPQWIDELYAAFLKRTGVAPESAALLVERNPDTGAIQYTYKSITSFDEDGAPVFMSHVPFPLYAWEYGRRILDQHPFARPVALVVLVAIASGLTLLVGRNGRQ